MRLSRMRVGKGAGNEGSVWIFEFRSRSVQTASHQMRSCWRVGAQRGCGWDRIGRGELGKDELEIRD